MVFWICTTVQLQDNGSFDIKFSNVISSAFSVFELHKDVHSCLFRDLAAVVRIFSDCEESHW